MANTYKRFPPRHGHLLIPTTNRDSALAGLSLYAPTKVGGIAVQRAAWLVTRTVGPRFIPARSTRRLPEFIEKEAWQALLDDWQRRLGSFEDVAIYRPPDAKRIGLAALLITRGRPLAFVKLRDDQDAHLLQKEEEALRRLGSHEPETFSFAAALLSGEVSGWHYLALEPLEPRPHAPPKSPPIIPITSEIQDSLARLPRPAEAMSHWVPMHGDFAPWNLRTTHHGKLTLLDWEAAAWGPPGADLVMYSITSAAVGMKRPPIEGLASESFTEARQHWRQYWQKRLGRHQQGDPYPRTLAGAVMTELDRLETAG